MTHFQLHIFCELLTETPSPWQLTQPSSIPPLPYARDASVLASLSACAAVTVIGSGATSSLGLTGNLSLRMATVNVIPPTAPRAASNSPAGLQTMATSGRQTQLATISASALCPRALPRPSATHMRAQATAAAPPWRQMAPHSRCRRAPSRSGVSSKRGPRSTPTSGRVRTRPGSRPW